MALTESVLKERLNRMSPAAHDARLGDVIEDLITNYNKMQASFADLKTKYANLLAHLDTANVAGIGNTNASTYGSAVVSGVSIKTLSQR
ncbi:hypothetical protein AWB80_07575 [Caballeronia pedi]|uniref:Uncharacterized protein n=1 Tax=Caballeronia pedi TaxID=1777141 RepID=A0A158DWX6_9BURK|nr:hypothetical protein [Caballeronia pedi]SAK98716.1 hypothetical protein AWB80_07575 [Caballeronia pedi]